MLISVTEANTWSLLASTIKLLEYECPYVIKNQYLHFNLPGQSSSVAFLSKILVGSQFFFFFIFFTV